MAARRAGPMRSARVTPPGWPVREHVTLLGDGAAAGGQFPQSWWCGAGGV
jgi:hypothetical protein